MKCAIFFLLSFFSFSGALYAGDIKTDESMWLSAYEGNSSLVHKMALTRQLENINDEMINQFVMAYVYYKSGKYEEIESIFEGVDSYIEHFLIPKEMTDVLE